MRIAERRARSVVVARTLLAIAATPAIQAACAAAPPTQPQRPSARRHDAEAPRHAHVATAHGGGQPVPFLRPCWTSEQHPSRARLEIADAERDAAARYRAIAASVRRAERATCQGLGEQDISQSPFFHQDDILWIEEVRDDDGGLRGARVMFRKVPGLTVAWMNRALSCHQARAAAAGYDRSLMSYCPVMVAPTRATVQETRDAIVVTLIPRRERDIALVVHRAEHLFQSSDAGPD